MADRTTGTGFMGRIKRQGAGRPGGSTQNRDEILDAAERLFADAGYAATSLKDITAAAGVTQAMVNYYFGSKIKLFQQVYLRKGEALQQARLALLDELKERGGFDVSDVIRAYLVPAFQLQTTVAGRHYLRIQARMHTEPDALAYKLRQEVYDVPVRTYIAALAALLPDLEERVIFIRFTEVIGIYLYILSGAHRIEQISEARYMLPVNEDMIEEIVAFATAGLKR
ncbi:TetR/AcrR family transcriptional regulator [Corticibacterium sp. UT-5YL-CI-8]|nr:TetR/AcrR family transcriptional regulator [Tianweitania sp. UT-5YL-CI-8]